MMSGAGGGARLEAVLGGARMAYGEAGRALGVHPNSLRYAAATGTVVIRWEGARQPAVWTVPPPGIDPRDARLELACRYLHIYGPAGPEAFGGWAGIGRRRGVAAFEALRARIDAKTAELHELRREISNVTAACERGDCAFANQA